MIAKDKRVRLSFIVIGLFILLAFGIYAGCCLCNENTYITPNPVIDKKRCQIVCARYKEDVDYLNDAPFAGFPVVVYEKGGSPASNLSPLLPITHVTLPNLGRETQSYLYHIVTNYDNLADVTLFLPGSCLGIKKKHKTYQLIDQVLSTGDTSFNGFPSTLAINTIFSVHQVSSYESTNFQNRTRNETNCVLPATVRPLGKWWDAFIGNTHTNHFYSVFCIFAVSRKHIRANPKEFYERLLQENSRHSNCEAGFYSELSWVSVFTLKADPIPRSCFRYENPCRTLHGWGRETWVDPKMGNLRNLANGSWALITGDPNPIV